MSDIHDRLQAADPAATQPYLHQNLTSMIARVTRQPIEAKNHLWRNFQLKVAGALAASTAITVGAIAALSGGPALATLAIASTGSPGASTFSAQATIPKSSAMMIYEKFVFSAGDGLDGSTPSSASVELQAPANGSDEASRLAKIFGVSGTPVDTDSDGSYWTVTDPAGDTLGYMNSGLPQWNYNAGSTGATFSSEAASLAALPSVATAASTASNFFATLGYDYQLSAPDVETSTSSQEDLATGSVSATSTDDVSYGVIVNGVATDQSVNISINAAGDVVSASGPAFSADAPVNYPLQSLQSGVAALNAEQDARYPSTADTSTDSSDAPSAPPIVNVTLNSAAISFSTYQLTDDSIWLLPVYDYNGTITSSDNGQTGAGVWSELAVDPSYVKVSKDASSLSNRPMLF